MAGGSCGLDGVEELDNVLELLESHAEELWNEDVEQQRAEEEAN